MSGTDDAARAARTALEPLLADAPAIGSGLPAGALDRLERYVALLLEANARLNLTRVVAPPEVARWHLLDSLAALPLLSETDGPVADLGSGGGLPAVPLAIARPDLGWTLVESVGKKAHALREIVEALGLEARVVADRAETLGRDPMHRERYAAVTARAVSALPVLAELALPLLSVGGNLLAWKGPLTDADDEVRRGRVAIGQLGGGPLSLQAALPALGDHTFVVVPKVRPTAARFPRRAGEPARRPLG
ncbi:MAG TPA: 16S rRNA (guanine(527)-N(7))-methyltransferase RsmG [Candidatus Limnocylindria bacterium]|nr:16S rRNA (guanine(527)-N(7))-methyltransferase RsmG [Candidatus Limnocylindria bacterium]